MIEVGRGKPQRFKGSRRSSMQQINVANRKPGVSVECSFAPLSMGTRMRVAAESVFAALTRWFGRIA